MSARHERHECDTSATLAIRVRHKCDTSATRTTRGTILEMLRSHAKIRLKSVPQKLTFLMTKALSKSFILDCSCKCPCTFPHSYA